MKGVCSSAHPAKATMRLALEKKEQMAQERMAALRVETRSQNGAEKFKTPL